MPARTWRSFAGAEVIDLRDRFVLPGLIDSHVHLTSDTGGVPSQLEQVQLSPAAKAYNALVNARKTLAAGFTTVRNLGDRDGVTLALRDADRAPARCAGPSIVDAGTSISTTAGHMDAGARLPRRPARRARPRRQPLRRRRRLPPRRAAAGRARRRRDQDRDHRRRQQPHRRRPRPADVRRRGPGDRRDRAPVRQEGRGARARRGRRQGRARRRRRLDRARHDARRRVPRAVPQVGRVLRADAVDRQRLPRAHSRPTRTPTRPRCAPRSTGASRSPASRCARPCRAA